MEIQKTQLKIGSYQIKAISTCEFGLDGGAMFGTVPKVLWEKSNPADAANRIKMEARVLLLQSDDRLILVDCGLGAHFIEKYGEKAGAKFSEMYNVSGSESGLILELKRLGISADQVTDVILTHLHFDHCGGATMASDGKLVPTFKNARYYIQKRNYETAKNPNRREKASYFAVNFEPLVQSGVVEWLDGDKQNLLSGISVAVTDGHTQGQQTVRVSDGKTTLYYCADLIPTSSHVRLAWVMGYDLNPLQLIEEKAKLLTEAAKENAYLFFEHDPYAAVAQVAVDGSDFKVTSRFNLE